VTSVPNYRYFVDGSWRNAASAELFEDYEPYSGKLFVDSSGIQMAFVLSAVFSIAGALIAWAFGATAPPRPDGRWPKTSKSAQPAPRRRRVSHLQNPNGKAMRSKLLIFLCLIASVFLSAPVFAQSRGSVLFIMSATRELPLKEGRSYQNAGVYLGEISAPVQAVLAAGYTPVFASPGGVAPTIDPFSEQAFFFPGGAEEAARAKTLVESLEGFRSPRKLSDVAAAGIGEFVGVFVPGGFAPMGDLMTEPDAGRILRDFHEAGRPIAMVCHGPIALIATMPNAGAFKAAIIAGEFQRASELATDWPFAGYRLTIFSSSEEPLARRGPLKGEPQFYVSDAMAQAGAHVDRRQQSRSNVIEDRELLTGQNPLSAEELSRVFVKRLATLAGH
jgi:putative intracellular protease/amidase